MDYLETSYADLAAMMKARNNVGVMVDVQEAWDGLGQKKTST